VILKQQKFQIPFSTQTVKPESQITKPIEMPCHFFQKGLRDMRGTDLLGFLILMMMMMMTTMILAQLLSQLYIYFHYI